ncbi:hypothetical protein [Burkholderia sp. Ac-20353]|uniref:hypothetical protein n=1 Tax=Burkholderia sp. Ac-20353 TaxID=2703894 RepID=UPI00197B9EAA|nr:hypothetical protein [Burkholderia sp. Ac-20353]MBN3786527.1 hypothetical protein [Burkholderia sp. Ac-20353]
MGLKIAKALRYDAGTLIGERQHRETIEHLRNATRLVFTPVPRAEWSKLDAPPDPDVFIRKYHAVGLSEASLAARHATFARSAWVNSSVFIFLCTLLACAIVLHGVESASLVLAGLCAVSISGALWWESDCRLWTFMNRRCGGNAYTGSV